MNEVKHVFKIFTPDNYEKEEKFLREMSLRGWHFVSFSVFLYKFEKGLPESYSYKLDFRKDIKDDKDNYITTYEDCGWVNIFEFPIFKGAWEYFRKESVQGTEEDLFTDNESKIELLTRIRRFYLYVAIFFFSINLVNFVNVFNYITRGYFPMLIFMVIYGILIGLYTKTFVRISMKIDRLKENRYMGD